MPQPAFWLTVLFCSVKRNAVWLSIWLRWMSIPPNATFPAVANEPLPVSAVPFIVTLTPSNVTGATSRTRTPPRPLPVIEAPVMETRLSGSIGLVPAMFRSERIWTPSRTLAVKATSVPVEMT